MQRGVRYAWERTGPRDRFKPLRFWFGSGIPMCRVRRQPRRCALPRARVDSPLTLTPVRMNAPVVRKLVTPLAVVTVLAAVYQLFGAWMAFRARNWPFVLFYVLFAVAGLALARALWNARATYDAAAAARAAATESERSSVT